MAQDPFLIDQIQIEPGSGQTLLVSRDAATGALRLQDAVTTGGILLHQLAGLRAIGNVYVVGKTGTGAEYTTIQSALDAVPSAASSANPYIVLVMPGIYTETVNIARDGVRLVGLGNPLIRSALELTPDCRVAPRATFRTRNMFFVEDFGNLARTFAPGKILEDPVYDHRFGGVDAPLAAVVIRRANDNVISVRLASRHATLPDPAELSPFGFVPKVTEGKLRHGAQKTDVHRGDLTNIDRMYLDVSEGQPIMKVGDVREFATETIKGFTHQDVK